MSNKQYFKNLISKLSISIIILFTQLSFAHFHSREDQTHCTRNKTSLIIIIILIKLFCHCQFPCFIYKTQKQFHNDNTDLSFIVFFHDFIFFFFLIYCIIVFLNFCINVKKKKRFFNFSKIYISNFLMVIEK